jgi:putative flippase GtrA
MVVRHFIRYAVVGVFATAAQYCLLIVCVEFGGWQAFVASGFGAVVGAQVAYAGNRWFTFDHRGELLSSWLRFQATAMVGVLLGMALVGVAVHLGLHYLIAQVIATLLSMAITFAINRAWTFRHR